MKILCSICSAQCLLSTNIYPEVVKSAPQLLFNAFSAGDASFQAWVQPSQPPSPPILSLSLPPALQMCASLILFVVISKHTISISAFQSP